jgi:hypothetical protein
VTRARRGALSAIDVLVMALLLALLLMAARNDFGRYAERAFTPPAAPTATPE